MIAALALTAALLVAPAAHGGPICTWHHWNKTHHKHCIVVKAPKGMTPDQTIVVVPQPAAAT